MSRGKVGVISDTHGPVSQAALDALAGVDHIIHAGDIVSSEALAALEQVAATTAVRGNMDAGSTLPSTNVAAIAGVRIFVLHDLHQLNLNPAGAGVAAVIHGHTHRSEINWRGGVLYLNPGSARPGPRSSMARLTIEDGTLTPEIVVLGR